MGSTEQEQGQSDSARAEAPVASDTVAAPPPSPPGAAKEEEWPLFKEFVDDDGGGATLRILRSPADGDFHVSLILDPAFKGQMRSTPAVRICSLQGGGKHHELYMALASLWFKHNEVPPTPPAALTAQLAEARAAALEVCKDAEEGTPPFVCIGESGTPIVEAETLGQVITQLTAWGDKGYQALAAATQRAEQAESQVTAERQLAETEQREILELAARVPCAESSVEGRTDWVDSVIHAFAVAKRMDGPHAG